jgi:hypothetical protein
MRLQQAPRGSLITSACPKCTQNFHSFNRKMPIAESSPSPALDTTSTGNVSTSFNKTNDKTIKHFLDLVDRALNIEIAAVY